MWLIGYPAILLLSGYPNIFLTGVPIWIVNTCRFGSYKGVDLNRKHMSITIGKYTMVQERRLVSVDIWNKPLSLNNGNIIRLSNFKGKVVVLLLFAYDIVSPSAISGLNALQDKFSKWNVAVIGLHDGAFDPKHERSYIANKSTTFPLVAVESEFIWRIQRALISPGTLAFPQVVLIGKDGNVVIRFNEWNGDSASKKALCDEIEKALNASP